MMRTASGVAGVAVVLGSALAGCGSTQREADVSDVEHEQEELQVLRLPVLGDVDREVAGRHILEQRQRLAALRELAVATPHKGTQESG